MASGKYVSFEDRLLSRVVRILEEQELEKRDRIWKDHSDMVNCGLALLLNNMDEDVPEELLRFYKDKIRDTKVDKKRRDDESEG